MKATPLLFKPAMILAMLREIAAPGTGKTQTRRLVKRQHYSDEFNARCHHVGVETAVKEYGLSTPHLRCPYGMPGDVLWAKETWRWHNDGTWIHYLADNRIVPLISSDAAGFFTQVMQLDRKSYKWRSSMLMFKKHSRITMPLTEVRIQRLQDITREDAIAEGMACLSKDQSRTWKYGLPDADGQPGNDDFGWPWSQWNTDPVLAYKDLWDEINGDGIDSWRGNPWVWTLTFTPRLANVNAHLERKAA